MSVEVADKYSRLMTHAKELQDWPAVTLEVILAEHVFKFEPCFKALGAEVFDAFQLGELESDLLEHVGLLPANWPEPRP